MANIVVSATSLRVSGGLTILKQFIKNIPVNSDNYYIIVDSDFKKIEKKGVSYINKNTRNQYERIKFDFYGFKKLLKRYNIKPDIIISLQNNAVKYSLKTPQIVYYHIPIPVFPHKWSFFKRNERGLYLYKKLYPIIIKALDYGKVKYTAQIPSIKRGMNKYLGIEEDRIIVIAPDTPPVKNLDKRIERDNIFIYPATPLIYKNHRVLIEACSILLEKYPDLKASLKIFFSIKKGQDLALDEEIKNNGLDGTFIMDGPIPFENLLEIYSRARALLFPSYIETFGLPLLEAASYGLPIIAADLPYAHDVIGAYKGVTFIDPYNAVEWARQMKKLLESKCQYESFAYKDKESWKDFFELVEEQKKLKG